MPFAGGPINSFVLHSTVKLISKIETAILPENLASKIYDTFKEEKISKIIFEKRGDISRFNYYLNRNNNK